MKQIAIIGCGALGQILAKNLKKILDNDYFITGVFDFNYLQSEDLAEEIGCKSYKTISDLIEDKPDYAVEIASISAVQSYGEDILKGGINLIVVSVGALADSKLKARLRTTADKYNKKIYVVNGAIGGFDLMQTYALMGPSEVSIENIKAPESLNGAPYLSGHILSNNQVETIFDGSVEDAIKGFPKNVNVAVATSIASENPETRVIIKSVPGLSENQHIIRLHNDTMRAELAIFSTPDPVNPKSSICTAWSVIALLKNLASPICYF